MTHREIRNAAIAQNATIHRLQAGEVVQAGDYMECAVGLWVRLDTQPVVGTKLNSRCQAVRVVPGLVCVDGNPCATRGGCHCHNCKAYAAQK